MRSRHLLRKSRTPGRLIPTPSLPAASPVFEGLETLEPRTLLSSAVHLINPLAYAAVSAGGSGTDSTVVKITAKPKASETKPTASGKGQFTISRSGGSTASDLTVYYIVTGTATSGDDYAALADSVVIPAGKKSAVIDLIPVDDTLAEAAETVIVTLTPDIAYNLGAGPTQSAAVTISDNEPTVKIAAKPKASETKPTASGKGQFTVSRAGSSTTSDLTVYYAVAGTATPGDDYTALTGSVVIPAGKASATIDVFPVDDPLPEEAETVVVTLTPDIAYNLGAGPTQSATITIADNEPMVKITAKPKASETSPSSKGKGQFTVTRSGGSTALDLTVYYNVDGSAAPGDDYDTLVGSVVIPAGKTSATIDVVPVDDAVAETGETVVLTLCADDCYCLCAAPLHSATVTIADNEPVLKITATKQASEANPTTTGKGLFTVTRSGGSTASDLTVYYNVEGTADAGKDYESLTGSVVIPAGKTSATIDVVPIADTDLDDAETVVVTLASDASYNLGTPAQSAATVKITNALGVDFLDATGFSNSGARWYYDVTATGGRGTASAYASYRGHGNYRFAIDFESDEDDVITPTQEFNWVSTSDGVWFNYTSAELDELLSSVDGEMEISQLQICPPILAGSFTDSSPMTLSLGEYGSLSGSITITTSLVGVESVSVPAGRFTAYKITMKITDSAKGTIYPYGDDEGYGMSASENTLNTFWAVPGVGIVKYTMNASARASVSGYGSVSDSIRVTMLLTDYEV